MTEQPRDWDRELADIDRAMEKQGGAPAGPGGGAVPPRPAPAALPRGSEPAAARGSVAITWMWVLFAVALAAALPLWPYQRACGLQAFFFLGAAGVTVVVGTLAALSSWANRRGFAHVLSLLVVAWGAIVAAGEVLPRVGYARETRTWTCTAPASTAPAAAPAPRNEAAPAPDAQSVPEGQSESDAQPGLETRSAPPERAPADSVPASR